MTEMCFNIENRLKKEPIRTIAKWFIYFECVERFISLAYSHAEKELLFVRTKVLTKKTQTDVIYILLISILNDDVEFY